MYYAHIWTKRARYVIVKGRTWTALRKGVEAEMKKKRALYWCSVLQMKRGEQILYDIGESRTMKKFPLKEPPTP
jgi:hypothetical protein